MRRVLEGCVCVCVSQPAWKLKHEKKRFSTRPSYGWSVGRLVGQFGQLCGFFFAGSATNRAREMQLLD